MSKTHVGIEVRMTPEQIEGARANLMEMHPDMSGFPAENVEVENIKQ